MKLVLAAALLAPSLILAGCATEGAAIAPVATTAPPAASSGSPEVQAEVLGVVDKFLLAIGNHDDAALEELLMNEGVAYFQELKPGKSTDVKPYTNESMFEPDPDADPFIERYWNPIVQIRGGIAQVWAPYELRDNGKQVHCGIDAFTLVDLDGAWRVATIMSTMEPKACTEMMPPNPSAMRPRDGWKEHGND